MQYKALICDVDGTLILNRRDAVPSKKVEQTINKARDIVHIGVATSHPLHLLNHIFDQLNLRGLSVINGGSQVIDLPSKKIVWEKTIEEKDSIEIFKILNNLHIPFFTHDGEKDIVMPKAGQIGKIFNIAAVELFPEIADEIKKQISILPHVAIHKVPDWQKGKFSVVISHALATKQHGIFEVMKILNIKSEEIIGVGDGANDLPLLLSCGLKVAMGNAVAELKDIADYIAPSVEDDGLADVINKFILNNHLP